MKISRDNLRLLILEEIQRSQSDGKVFFGWIDAVPGIFGIMNPIKHAFIRLERYGSLPDWWPFSKNIVSLSGFSENWDALDIRGGELGTLDDILSYQWGRLVKAVDWGQDVKGKEDGDAELPIPEGMSLDDVQKRIIKAFNAYGERDKYSPLPEKSNDPSVRNSNSLAFSLLRHGFGPTENMTALADAGVNVRAFAGSSKRVSGL